MHEIVLAAGREVRHLQLIIYEYLKEALDWAAGELDALDLIALVEEDKAQLWLIFGEESRKLRAVATTMVVQYPRLKVVRVVTLAGEGMDEWAGELAERLEKFARGQECQRLEAFGRKGLEKKLGKLGFRAQYVTLVKEVEGGEDGQVCRIDANGLDYESASVPATIH